MDKETKILLVLAYLGGLYLLLKKTNAFEKQVPTSDSNATPTNIAPIPILPNAKNTNKAPQGLAITEEEIKKHNAMTPSIDSKNQANSYYPEFKAQIYKMTDAEWAACKKDPRECKV